MSSSECGTCERDLRRIGHASDCPLRVAVLPNGGRHLMPMIRVACITFDGTTLTVPAAELAQHLETLDDSPGDIEGDALTYALTFKTMLQMDFDALGDFNGF